MRPNTRRWINTRVVSDSETGKILEREGYWYEGEIESCDPVTLSIIAAAATIAGTGTGLGLELANQPGKPKPPPPPTPAQINTNQNAERAAISAQAPNVISATSGLANPDYVAQISQLLAGTGGQTGSTGAARQAIASAFGIPESSITSGTGGGGTTPFTPAGAGPPNPNSANEPVNLSDFVGRFF